MGRKIASGYYLNRTLKRILTFWKDSRDFNAEVKTLKLFKRTIILLVDMLLLNSIVQRMQRQLKVKWMAINLIDFL